jgi:oxygen-independent coproporphyrinogen-3 oxidase
MFLRPSEFELDVSGPPPEEDREEIKRRLYRELSRMTGRHPVWGTLTGVKPLKLFSALAEKTGGAGAAKRKLRDEYYVSPEKLCLLEQTWRVGREVLRHPPQGAVSVYVGIPFCPSRCAYCSFVSGPYEEKSAARYLDALHREIAFVAEQMDALGLYAESIYVGGGTPTALNAQALERLLHTLTGCLPTAERAEYTVEAGRPDTLTDEMCDLLAACGAGRISINPQTMRDATLARIGRRHDAAMTGKAFEAARKAGLPLINADIIAGLPGEDASDFAYTLDAILALKPENITVHTLSVKKGSNFREADEELCYNIEGSALRMLDGLPERLRGKGFRPYYLYRQKQTVDNLENVGYALPGAECVYNMRIMEEKQTVIAMGAGGSSKVFFPQENRIERIFNVSDHALYAARIGEMIERKRIGLFGALRGCARPR